MTVSAPSPNSENTVSYRSVVIPALVQTAVAVGGLYLGTTYALPLAQSCLHTIGLPMGCWIRDRVVHLLSGTSCDPYRHPLERMKILHNLISGTATSQTEAIQQALMDTCAWPSQEQIAGMGAMLEDTLSSTPGRVCGGFVGTLTGILAGKAITAVGERLMASGPALKRAILWISRNCCESG